MVQEKKSPVHFTEMLHLMQLAAQRGQEVTLKAWKTHGEVAVYRRWIIHSDYWKGGYLRLRNPRNGEIRLVPEIFIKEFCGHKIYL